MPTSQPAQVLIHLTSKPVQPAGRPEADETPSPAWAHIRPPLPEACCPLAGSAVSVPRAGESLLPPCLAAVQVSSALTTASREVHRAGPVPQGLFWELGSGRWPVSLGTSHLSWGPAGLARWRCGSLPGTQPPEGCPGAGVCAAVTLAHSSGRGETGSGGALAGRAIGDGPAGDRMHPRG